MTEAGLDYGGLVLEFIEQAGSCISLGLHHESSCHALVCSSVALLLHLIQHTSHDPH